MQVVFKDKSLDEVTQVECGGEQRLFWRMPFTPSPWVNKLLIFQDLLKDE